MESRTQKILFVLLGVLIALTVWDVGRGRTKHVKQDISQKQDISKERGTITSVPQIISCPRNVRVVKAEIRNAGTTDATVSVEVENTADVGIIAIAMTSAKGREGFTVTHRSSFEGDRKPIVVIKPHETDILVMAVSNVYTGVPIKIEGAMYADGTDDGCDLTNLHLARDQDRAKRKDP